MLFQCLEVSPDFLSDVRIRSVRKQSMAYQLHKVGVRKALQPRREPYWGAPIGRGRVLGFRKIDASSGSWIARMRDETGHKVYKALGFVTESLDYEAARTAALAWFTAQDAGVAEGEATVADACRSYVKDREREKGKACAHDAEKRFDRTVFDTPFGAIQLAKLRTPRIKEWRDGLKLGKGSANRTLTALKAALNLAVTNRLVHPIAAREWGDVKPYKDATKRRSLFLDLKQRRALLAQTSGGLHDLLEAVALTGARAGELSSATRAQFDSRTKCMTFKGKTGTRTVPLSQAALTLFTRLAKSKLPGAFLFTRDDGKPWSSWDWDELIREAAERAKLPKGVCLYTLRHSFITQAINDGMTTLDVARLCGTSVTMIEKHYGHLVDTSARERLAAVTML
jgi:integrase